MTPPTSPTSIRAKTCHKPSPALRNLAAAQTLQRTRETVKNGFATIVLNRLEKARLSVELSDGEGNEPQTDS